MRYKPSLLVGLCLLALPVAYVPAWWRQGWPRGRVGSLAEAELLSQLAVLLMPRTDIWELFRSFPATEGWSGYSFQPDLAAHGVLRDRNAAIFVEYDGFWRHGETEGIAKDQQKNAALLAYAPVGSLVVRISHTVSKPCLQGHVLWIRVDPWRQGEERSLAKALHRVLAQMVACKRLRDALRPSVFKQIQGHIQNDSVSMLHENGKKCALEAAILVARNSTEEVSQYPETEGFCLEDLNSLKTGILSHTQSIEGQLKPKIRWLLELGLSKRQVAKAVAGFPRVLGYSIEQNLKPTVQWLLELGLSKRQVAKAVAGFHWAELETNGTVATRIGP